MMAGFPVTLVGDDGMNPASAANPLPVGLAGYSASASFTPAASSHTAGDSVGVAAEFVLGAPAGDTGDFVLASGDRAAFLGYFDFAQLVDVGDTLYIEAAPNKIIKLTGTSIFAYLVNLTTLTPQAVAHTVRLNCQVIAD